MSTGQAGQVCLRLSVRVYLVVGKSSRVVNPLARSVRLGKGVSKIRARAGVVADLASKIDKPPLWFRRPVRQTLPASLVLLVICTRIG